MTAPSATTVRHHPCTMPRQTLDSKYKTRIPWRQVLNLSTSEGIPHGKRNQNSSDISKRRKNQANERVNDLRSSLAKIHHDPWRKKDERFFGNKIFLKEINNHVVENLPTPSSFDPSRSMSLSSIEARNYLDDIVDPRFTKGLLQPRTASAIGPGSYLEGGSRSVLRLQPLRKKPKRAVSLADYSRYIFLTLLTTLIPVLNIVDGYFSIPTAGRSKLSKKSLRKAHYDM